MWPPGSIGIENIDFVLDQRIIHSTPKFQPTPYIFTKIENGKKKTADSALTPPIWLLLDHTIAVIWTIFNPDAKISPLSIDDLKWAYEFLKGIKNKEGENPPDVKVCLKEIQDRLINLYAKLPTLKEEYLDEIAAAFGEKLLKDATSSYFKALLGEKKNKKADETLSKTSLAVIQSSSSKDVETENEDKNIGDSKTMTPQSEKSDEVFQDAEGNEANVEKYVLSLFEGNMKDNSPQSKQSTKSLIPVNRKTSASTEVHPSRATSCEATKKEKTSKRVHCYAEMRSLKFQKSMKVKDLNGEEAAYSNLKAEIQRLTINPNVSREEVMKFLKEWRLEQVDRLHNELKKLGSIDEFMKNLNLEEVKPNNQKNSKLNLKLKEFDG